VKQRSGHRDVAVDAWEERGCGAHTLRDRERVVEQAVAVSLVVVLRRRSVAKARPAWRLGAEEALEEAAQVRLLHGGDQLAQVRFEPLDRDRRAVDDLLRVVFGVLRGADALDGDLAPELGVDREAARDMDDAAGLRGGEAVADLLPGDALHRSGAVGEHQLEEVLAVLLLAQLALAHAEDRRDLLAVGEVAQAQALARRRARVERRVKASDLLLCAHGTVQGRSGTGRFGRAPIRVPLPS
jgi:hypothetical protein